MSGVAADGLDASDAVRTPGGLEHCTAVNVDPDPPNRWRALSFASSIAVSKVIAVDDFAPEALSPIYKKPAEVHQFFQELGETRAAS